MAKIHYLANKKDAQGYIKYESTYTNHAHTHTTDKSVENFWKNNHPRILFEFLMKMYYSYIIIFLNSRNVAGEGK